jgi:ribosome modulation factor
MKRTERDRFENQQIEGSWKKLGLAGHTHS